MDIDDIPILAPDLGYRIVTGTSLSLQGDQPAPGGVRFFLDRTVAFTEARVVIEPSAISLKFKDYPNGKWSVRLPHAGNAASELWGIWVKFSARPYPYLIRVPPGTSPLNILSIPEWRP